MRVVGVLDLMGGRAVHARGGRRDRYAPVAGAGTVDINGDAIALARTYVDQFGIRELYVADLDAIVSGRAQSALVRSIAREAPIWLDAGASSGDAARAALAADASRVVIGLETLSSFDVLADVCASIGGERVAFSLDLRGGIVLSRNPSIAAAAPVDIAKQAVEGGVGAVIVLDLARVGAGMGVDLEMIRCVRAAVPGVLLLAGGGVRGLEDLTSLAAAGCDGALVASAIHAGRLSAADLAAASAIQRSVSR